MHKNTDSIWTQVAQLLKLLTPSHVTSSLMICHLVVCSVLGNASPQRQVMLLAMCSYLGTHPILDETMSDGILIGHTVLTDVGKYSN